MLVVFRFIFKKKINCSFRSLRGWKKNLIQLPALVVDELPSFLGEMGEWEGRIVGQNFTHSFYTEGTGPAFRVLDMTGLRCVKDSVAVRIVQELIWKYSINRGLTDNF